MTCNTDETRSILRGTTEYLNVSLTADVTLDTQTVEITLNGGTTWLPTDAVGSPGLTRVYRHLLTPEEQPDATVVEVLARITDTPEIVWLDAGTLTIE